MANGKNINVTVAEMLRKLLETGIRGSVASPSPTQVGGALSEGASPDAFSPLAQLSQVNPSIIGSAFASDGSTASSLQEGFNSEAKKLGKELFQATLTGQPIQIGKEKSEGEQPVSEGSVMRPSDFNRPKQAAPQGPQLAPQAAPLNQGDQQLQQRPDGNNVNQLLGRLVTHITGFPTKGAIDFFREERIKSKTTEAEEVPLSKARREELKLSGGLELDKAGQLSGEKLFSQFEKASEPFTEVRDGFARIQGALENPKTGQLDFSGANPAGDLDLLFGTAKTLDPSGRVTDSDIAIQQAATGAYGDRFKKIAQKFQRRGFLTPDERKALFNAAVQRFKASEKQQKRTVEQFSTLAKRQGFDPQNLFRDVGLASRKGTINQNLRVVSITEG